MRLHHSLTAWRRPEGIGASARAAQQCALRAPRQRVPGHRHSWLGAGEPCAGHQVNPATLLAILAID